MKMRLNSYKEGNCEYITLGPILTESCVNYGRTTIYVDGLDTSGGLRGGLVDIIDVNDTTDVKWVEGDISVDDNAIVYTLRNDRFKVFVTVTENSATYKAFTYDTIRIIKMNLVDGKVIKDDKTYTD